MAADSLLHLPTTTKQASKALPDAEPSSSDSARPTTTRLVGDALLLLDAWSQLAFYDVLSLFGYKRLHAFTRSRAVSRRTPMPETVQRVCAAVKEACVWYPKRAYCLQRSSVITWMLRRRGVAADLVIGYRPVPVDSHAWVEVGGAVVNDRPQYQKFYQVLDRL